MTMHRHGWVAGMILGAIVTGAVGLAAAQRAWTVPTKARTNAGGQPAATALVGRTQAVLTSAGSGMHCTDSPENAVDVHDLGAIPAGVRVTVTVESYQDEFDPVATVVVPTIGQKAAGTAKFVTFYDNDSGGEKDPRLEFVTPQTGTYLLLVGDYTDTAVGCYRYEVLIQ